MNIHALGTGISWGNFTTEGEELKQKVGVCTYAMTRLSRKYPLATDLLPIDSRTFVFIFAR